MNKESLLERIKIREEDIEKLKMEKKYIMPEFKDFVERSGFNAMTHVHLMNKMLKISDNIEDLYKEIRKCEEEMNDMNQGDDITDDSEQASLDEDRLQ